PVVVVTISSVVVILIVSGSFLTVAAVVVPAGVSGNADDTPADDSVVALVVDTNNVGASADDSVGLDVLAVVVVFTSPASVKGDDASVFGAAVVGANVDFVVPDVPSVVCPDEEEPVSVAAVAVPAGVAGNADESPADDSVVLDVLAVVVFTSPASVKGGDTSVFGAAVVGANVDFVVPDVPSVVCPDEEEPVSVAAVVVPAGVAGNADDSPADDSVVLDVLAVVVFTSPASVKGDDASVFGAAVVGANVDFVVPDVPSVVCPDEEEPVSVAAVVVPAGVAGNADDSPADDSVVLDVLAVVVFTSPASVKGDDASVFGAAVVGANVDFVVPDVPSVVCPDEEEPVSVAAVAVPAGVAGNADDTPADDSVVLDVLAVVVFTSPASVKGDDASVFGAAVVGANVDSVDKEP
ncbi:hypothetical protein M9458_001264, partial [Cirrhinus mrigala]